MKPKSIKLITNTILSAVLAMGIGTTSAFANETQTAAPESTAAAPVTGSIGTSVTTTTQDSALSELPADFFYVFKTIVIKIEIALTDDQVKQAKLHSVITQERIKRAEVLIIEGKTDLAVETLQQSVAEQDQEIEESLQSDKNENSDEIQKQLRDHIEALTIVMAKVKNPKAKAALAKNINKSKAKLLITIGQPVEPAAPTTGVTKVEVQLQAKPVKTEEIEADDENDDDDHEQYKDEDENDDEDSDDKDEARKAIHEKMKSERKAAHEQYKHDRKISHEQSKKEHKETHEKDNGDDED